MGPILKRFEPTGTSKKQHSRTGYKPDPAFFYLNQQERNLNGRLHYSDHSHSNSFCHKPNRRGNLGDRADLRGIQRR